MARRPNYDFERKERERAKATKVAERIKAKVKAEKPEQLAPEVGPAAENHVVDSST